VWLYMRRASSARYLRCLLRKCDLMGAINASMDFLVRCR
jgi:hypothetical protein